MKQMKKYTGQCPGLGHGLVAWGGATFLAHGFLHQPRRPRPLNPVL